MKTTEQQAEQRRQAKRSRTSERHRASGNHQFIRDTGVMERYDISRPTVWRWVREKIMPPPESLGPNTSRWRVTTLDEWDDQREIEQKTIAQ